MVINVMVYACFWTSSKMLVGTRVRFIGDDINNTDNIYTTLGTVTQLLEDGMVYVEWDDGTCQNDDMDDLEIVGMV